MKLELENNLEETESEAVRPQTLQVEIRSAFGKNRVFPHCERSKLFSQLLGLKTFTKEHVSIIEALGFKFELVENKRVSLESYICAGEL